MEKRKAIVIGAGVSGLSAAVAFKKKGFDVTVLEKQDRIGGVIDTFSNDGFLAESGSNTIMVVSPKMMDFLKECGMESDLVFSKKTAKKRFFVRDGKAIAVPSGPFSLLFTGLFSFFGKVRMLFEPFVKNTYTEDDDPSIEEFTKRRLGEEIYDYAINPMMAGIYAGNPAQLSIKHAFPPFWNFVKNYGSIIGGAIKSMRAKKREGNIFKPIMVSFKGGMKTLPQRLAENLDEGSIKLGARVMSVDYDGGKWQLSWTNGSEDVLDIYDCLLLAVPSKSLKKLPLCGPLAEKLEFADGISYAPIATYTMGFKKSQIGNKLDGFGALIPEKEKLSILGSLYLSSIFEDRAPKDCVVLTNYVGGMRNPEFAALPEDEIRAKILKDLSKVLALKGEPIFEKMFFWKNGIAQYNVGYQEFIDSLDEAEAEFENMKLVGAYRGGVGVGSCIENGIAAADALASANPPEQNG